MLDAITGRSKLASYPCVRDIIRCNEPRGHQPSERAGSYSAYYNIKLGHMVMRDVDDSHHGLHV
jgi:hypothetical protein